MVNKVISIVDGTDMCAVCVIPKYVLDKNIQDAKSLHGKFAQLENILTYE
jgi:hypothetical protein